MEQIANIEELPPGAECKQALTMLYVQQLLFLDDESKTTCCLYMAGSIWRVRLEIRPGRICSARPAQQNAVEKMVRGTISTDVAIQLWE